MKRVLFTLTLMIASYSYMGASNDFVSSVINLSFNYYDPYSMHVKHHTPRVPANSPSVIQDGHTITWGVEGFCESVKVVEPATEGIVYETAVSNTSIQITLPEELQGEYEIRFCREGYYYAGMIEL